MWVNQIDQITLDFQKKTISSYATLNQVKLHGNQGKLHGNQDKLKENHSKMKEIADFYCKAINKL